MRKKMFFAMVLLLVMGISNAWAEMKHTVEKGECLSLIGQCYGVPWQDIQVANGLKSETIFPGQQLLIPVSQKKVVVKKNRRVVEEGPLWTNTGADKYLASILEGLDILGYSFEAKIGLSEMVILKKRSFATISRDGVVTDVVGNHYRMEKMLCGGGKGKSIKIKTGPNGVIPNWPNRNKMEAGYIYQFGIDSLLVPLICGNPTLIVPIDEAPAVQSPAIFGTTQGQPISLVTGGVSATETQSKDCDSWDAYDGAGDYLSRKQGGDNHGWYAWSKLRVRPWCFKVGEKSNIGVGFFGFAAGGEGVAARYYDYGWKEAVLGMTAKITAEHKDFDIDLGVGKLYNRGKWKGDVTNKQVDDIFLGALHGNFYGRRDAGEKILPKTEANLEVRIPYNTNVKKGEKSDNQTVELMLTQWLYDFRNEDNSLNVAPGFNVGGGYEWGSDHESFLKIGPAVELSSYDNVVAGISIANYKFQGAGQWHPIGGYISIDGIYHAWYASQIKGATSKDLENLPANGDSKLLYNPADYLK